MTYTKEAFTAFKKENSNRFPYSEIMCTRTSYHAKWLLFNCKKQTSHHRPKEFFLLPTATLPLDQVQCLIMDKTAIPLPPLYSEVVDCTEWWGRFVAPKWEQDILEMFHHYLTDNSFGYDDLNHRKDLFYDCIAILVSKKVENYYPVTCTTYMQIDSNPQLQ